METLFTLNDCISIFVLLIILIILVIIVKYINGDFSVKSIEEIDRQTSEIKHGEYITKETIITYKYMYNDNRVKIKNKKTWLLTNKK